LDTGTYSIIAAFSGDRDHLLSLSRDRSDVVSIHEKISVSEGRRILRSRFGPLLFGGAEAYSFGS
jgi:hypothetical protein